MIHNFYRLYSIYNCKILALFSMLCSVSLWLILYIILCTSYFPTLILSLPTSLSPVVTTLLLYIWVCFFFVTFLCLLLWPVRSLGKTRLAFALLHSIFQGQTPSSNNTREDSTYGHHQMVNTKIRLILFFAARDALYSQQKQDRELTVAQIMNSLLPNSDLNWTK